MSPEEAAQVVIAMTAGHEGDRAYSVRVGVGCDLIAEETGLDSDELYDRVMGGE